MIISASKVKRRPAWYRRHVMRMVNQLAAGNPGFHRFVLCVPNEDGTAVIPGESPLLVNPNVEPHLRSLLSRILVLDEPIEDETPWGQL